MGAGGNKALRHSGRLTSSGRRFLRSQGHLRAGTREISGWLETENRKIFRVLDHNPRPISAGGGEGKCALQKRRVLADSPKVLGRAQNGGKKSGRVLLRPCSQRRFAREGGKLRRV